MRQGGEGGFRFLFILFFSPPHPRSGDLPEPGPEDALLGPFALSLCLPACLAHLLLAPAGLPRPRWEPRVAPPPVGTASGPALPCSGLQGQVAFPGPRLPTAGFPAHLLQKVVPAPQPASQQGSRKSQLSVLRVIKGNKQHPETISCLCYSSV